MRRSFIPCFAAALSACLLPGVANAQIVIEADVIGDVQLIGPDVGQDRGELILGNLSSGFRNYITRFDTTAYATQIADPTLTLTGAELILPEQSSRDGNNADLSVDLSAFFVSQASGDWVVPNNLPAGVFGATFSNRLTDRFNPDEFSITLENVGPGTDPVGANGEGRRRFAANGALGGLTNPNSGPVFGSHDQPDVLFSTDNTGSGFAPIGNNPSGTLNFTFQSGVPDVATIDLLGGNNVSPIQVQQVLGEWITGRNAGISLHGVVDVPGNLGQIFFQSADAFVDSFDGDFNPVGSGALDTYTGGELGETVVTESGNGEGGARLRLTFDTAPWDIAGDFNGDTVVNTADYAVWRDNLGSDETLLNGNGTGDGIVDEDDYQLWLFGIAQAAAGSPPALTAVPEPTSVCLAVFSLLGLGAGRRARS